MLKRIGLKNVRSFKNLKNFEFKPITVLCGTNSSGKSSIIKTILLWKQTLEQESLTRPGFLMNGRFTKLGSHNNFLYNKAKNKILETSFQFEFKKEGRTFDSELKEFVPTFPHIIEKLINLTISENEENSADYIELDFTLRYKADEESYLGIYIKQYILKITPFTNNSKKYPRKNKANVDNNFNTMEIKITSVKSENYKIEWENIAYRGVTETYLEGEDHIKRFVDCKKGQMTVPTCNFDNIFETLLTLDVGIEYNGKIVNGGQVEFEEEPFPILRILQIANRLGSVLEVLFAKITYIGPLREEPSRRYIFEDSVDDIGVKGENSAFLYHQEGGLFIEYMVFDSIKEEFVETGALAREAIGYWLSEIGIFGFTSDKIEELYRFSLNANEFGDEKVNISDVGFGVSQVVPIVIQGLLMDESESLILEQPEIHLHPKMQMKLADFILSLALHGKKVIIETHSEHIINRFVRRIVEDKSGKLNSLIGINFIKNTADGSICEAVNLSETKGIENWPEEFFDQAR